jgi:LmbE family N-acetylglucosaminyl deacetylase
MADERPAKGDVGRVLVVAAHPDDVDFGAAGTVAGWTAAGVEVSYCIVTDGDAGGAESGVARAEMAAVRREEQAAAAKVVGVSDLTWLGYADGRVEATLELRRDLTRVIRAARPDRVVLQSPERNWERIYASHPDHLAAGDAALCAVYPDARNAWAHHELIDEGYAPHLVPEVWMMASPHPNHYQDITDTIDRKIEALLAHRSQLPEPDAMADRIREWTRANAIAGGLGDDRYAEMFQIVDTA